MLKVANQAVSALHQMRANSRLICIDSVGFCSDPWAVESARSAVVVIRSPIPRKYQMGDLVWAKFGEVVDFLPC